MAGGWDSQASVTGKKGDRETGAREAEGQKVRVRRC